MKLIKKISQYFLINSAILFVIVFAGINFTLIWIISEEIDEQLRITNGVITKRFYQGDLVNDPPLIELIKVEKIPHQIYSVSDTLIYIESERENEPYHQITSYLQKDGVNYKLIVRASFIEKEDLFYSLLIIFSITFALLIVILFFINRKTTKDILVPFYVNLNLLMNYSVKSGNPINLVASKIEEFNELNLALNLLSDKASKEYKALKEFTEDVSHELQTPVSVIKSKLEILLQKDNLDEESTNNLQNAYKSINKLDKINRSLIFLAKLESKDLFEAERILLSEIVQNVVMNYSDIAYENNLIIHTELESEITVVCNAALIETLLNNLVSNSIKHNIKNGEIVIRLLGNILEISNTGELFSGNTDDFFNRFNKNSKKFNSTGLGLAIVKKICDMYEYKIDYFSSKGYHNVKVYFK